MSILSHWIRRWKAKRYRWQEASFQALLQRVPALAALQSGEIARLRQLTKEFLVDKVLHGAQGFELDESLRVNIATLACLPALYLGFEALQGWYDIVVYPDSFIAQRTQTDANGLVADYQQTLEGEAWRRGPVVLSAAAIERDLAQPGLGHSVVIHEIAHKIDGLNAAVDGVPPLSRPAAKAFSVELKKAHGELHQQLAMGIPDTLNPYASTSEVEFFAVASECFFMAPDKLRTAHPRFFAAMADFYRPDWRFRGV
jgi:MtfA peptidase